MLERKLTKCGSSLVVRMPMQWLPVLGWREGDRLDLTMEKDNTEVYIRRISKK